MKTKLLFIATAVLGLVLCLRAGTSQLVGTLTTVDGTNNTAPASFGAFMCFPPAAFSITNVALLSTNDLRVYGQFSLDGTNWTTVATYTPVTTNATNVTGKPAISPQAAYWRLQVVTTNSTDLSIVGQY
jgi:hypothetical protein